MQLNNTIAYNKYLIVSIVCLLLYAVQTPSQATISKNLTPPEKPLELFEQKRLKRVQDIALHKRLSIDCYRAAKKKHKLDREKAAKLTEKCRAKHIVKQERYLAVEEVQQNNEEASDNE